MVIRELVSLDVMSFIGVAGFLVNSYPDTIKFIVGVPLPRLVSLVSAVRRWHAVSLAIWNSVISLEGVISMGLNRMPDNVLVRVVVKYGASGEAWYFDVVANT